MPFRLFTELPDVHYLAVITFNRYLNEKCGGLAETDIASFSVFEKGGCRIYVDEKAEGLRDRFFRRFLADPRWFVRCHDGIRRRAKQYFEYGKRLREQCLTSLKDGELLAVFDEFYSEHTKNHHVGLIDVFLEIPEDLITTHLIGLIQRRAKGLAIDAGESFSLLTTPLEQSALAKERSALIRMALEAKDDKESLCEHFRCYAWLGYMFIGPPHDLSHFKDRLDEYAENPEKLLGDLQTLLSIKGVERDQTALAERLGFGKEELTLFRLARDMMYLKALRKEAMVHGWYAADALLEELARRIGTTKRLVAFLLPNEIGPALLQKKIPDLQARFDCSVVDFHDGKEEVIVGEAARALEAERQDTESASNVLEGLCAYKGVVRGKVRIVNVKEEIGKVEEGDILVSRSTNPDLLVAMERAAGIVTDRGGLTCHAAIVARELRKPCIIGTKHATKMLQDGYLIEIDASKGEVRILGK
ncbi:hypothetical protein GOV07_02370 [Candidatus Woesearchaeota archaeon]|nr:hypothetical protein [Candidatus Woesearchaeota archaeon]